MDWIKRALIKIRFGEITQTVRSIDGGHASEVEYFDRNGNSIGYWAYGSFDPAGKYRGL